MVSTPDHCPNCYSKLSKYQRADGYHSAGCRQCGKIIGQETFK